MPDTPAHKALKKANRESKLERFFAFSLKACGYNQFITEYRFGAESAGGPGKGLRKRLNAAGLKDWRFDFADPDNRVAVEIEGGVFVGGRHITGAGYRADCEKYNAATVLGWSLLRFTDREIKNGHALKILGRLYEAKQQKGELDAPPWSLTS